MAMNVPPTSESSASDAHKRAELVVDALGDVFPRWCAAYTMELLSMLQSRGVDVPAIVRPQAGQTEAEDELAAAPDSVREAYARANAAAEVVDTDEHEVRGRLIRNRLALALRKQHMTQSDLARRMGKHPSHVSRVFRNAERCRLTTLAGIAAALGVDLSDILRGFPDGK